jgi:hypothetical protein
MATLLIRFNEKEVEEIKAYANLNNLSTEEVLKQACLIATENDTITYEEVLSYNEVSINECTINGHLTLKDYQVRSDDLDKYF